MHMGAAGLTRMVNRNDRAVTATVVGGHIVYADGHFTPGFGTTLHAGTFLRPTQLSRALAAL
jgi:N-acyl-D-aspartate/D-glutamate deacylase